MKLNGILNRGVNEILSSLGHEQILIVCDAAFPIPVGVKCVDLSIKRGIPSLELVLESIMEEFITEKIIYAKEMADHNTPLHNEIKRIFPDCEHELVPAPDMLGTVANQAKAIIRTGAFSPWGNVALVSGTDPFAWFTSSDIKIPEFYKERMETIIKSGTRDKYEK